jgi:hypothetical protein
MRKVLFILVVFLFLHVTTYSLLPKEALQCDFHGNQMETSAQNDADSHYKASSSGGVFSFFGDCAPQPASVFLLTVSSLVLFNRKIRTPRPENY